MNRYLICILILVLLINLYFVSVLCRIKAQIAAIKDALEDIKNGNLNRRVLARKSDITREICYGINEITLSNQSRLIQQKQSEQAYKRLMTSLSHDVKTPLASLVGYLEAIENNIVVGAEKDEYIHVAFDKAHNLKDFVENLFEWVKLDSGEQVFHFEMWDINELSRDIITDWILILESKNFDYDFHIPELEYFIHIDRNAYTRILNNLLQNIMVHSEGNRVLLELVETEQQVKIEVKDNGKGIASEHLPHIFERMYQCEYSRTVNGNGLGLAITNELVHAHNGTITVSSILGVGTTFTIILPNNLKQERI